MEDDLKFTRGVIQDFISFILCRKEQNTPTCPFHDVADIIIEDTVHLSTELKNRRGFCPEQNPNS